MNKKSTALDVIQKGNSVFSSDTSYERALDVAKKISVSDLIPAAYKGKPSNCLIALDVARQVNSSPLIVMQNLNIILGKPSWSSTYIAGAIRTRYKKIKVILSGEGSERGCQVIAYDNDGEVLAEGIRVTMQMAISEGWVARSGSKWKTMPDLMLQYRANAFFGRVFCPDVLLGLQSEQEVLDVSENKVIDVVVDPFTEKEGDPQPDDPFKPEPSPPEEDVTKKKPSEVAEDENGRIVE